MENVNWHEPKNLDPLTGVHNRIFGFACLESWLQSCSRVGLLLCDLDGLKTYNDVCGLPSGDEALQSIGLLIEDKAENSLVFRYGGDEFLVVLPDASKAETKAIARAICENCAPIEVTDYRGEVRSVLSLSIGVAHCPDDTENVMDDLLHAAEIACLKLKKGGTLADGLPIAKRNGVMAWGDFYDDYPEQSARFLRRESK